MRTHPEALALRPDWYASLPAGLLRRPEIRSVAFRHPACAVALLTRRYEETAAAFEPALAGCGEAAFHLLAWAEREGVELRQPPSFYRNVLVRDGYWGARHARRTRDRALLADVHAWSEDQRRESGAAAAIFLWSHPREPVLPYRDAILSQPFYAYHSLPRLHPRGFRVGAAEGWPPKWAFHFAQSAFSAGAGNYFPAASRDPAWAIEYLHRRLTPDAPSVADALRAAAPDHPLLAHALGWLESRGVEPSVPAPLAWGRTAEAQALGALGRRKNTAVWRPTQEQIETPEFKRIVGEPRFTERGWPRGTVMDSVGGEFAEIKSGSSVLGPSYQLKLQAFRAVAEARPLRIYTNRPIDVEFAQKLEPLGVAFEPLPEP